jgi:hypothetical protein
MMLPDTEAPSGPGHTFGAQLQRYDLDTRDLAPLPAVGNGLSFGGGMAPDGSLLAQWSMAREALTHTLAFATEELGEVDVLPETSFQLEVAGLVSPAQAVVVPASPSYGALETGLVWDGPDRFWYLDPGGDPGYRSPGVTNPPSGVADLHRVQVTRDGASLTAVDEVAAQVDLGAMGDGGHATLISANDAAGRASIAFYAVDEFITEFSNPKLVVVDLASGAAVQEMPLAEVTPPDGLAASPNGRWVAALNAGQGNEGHYVRIVDLERFESRDIPSADVVGGPLVWSNGAWLGWRTADGWALADASDANRQTIHWRQPHDMSVPVTPDGSASGGNAGQLVNHEMVALAPDAPIALIRAGVVGQEGPLGGQAGKFYFEDLGTGNTEFIEEFDDLDPTVLAWLR